MLSTSDEGYLSSAKEFSSWDALLPHYFPKQQVLEARTANILQIVPQSSCCVELGFWQKRSDHLLIDLIRKLAPLRILQKLTSCFSCLKATERKCPMQIGGKAKDDWGQRQSFVCLRRWDLPSWCKAWGGTFIDWTFSSKTIGESLQWHEKKHSLLYTN